MFLLRKISLYFFIIYSFFISQIYGNACYDSLVKLQSELSFVLTKPNIQAFEKEINRLFPDFNKNLFQKTNKIKNIDLFNYITKFPKKTSKNPTGLSVANKTKILEKLAFVFEYYNLKNMTKGEDFRFLMALSNSLEKTCSKYKDGGNKFLESLENIEILYKTNASIDTVIASMFMFLLRIPKHIDTIEKYESFYKSKNKEIIRIAKQYGKNIPVILKNFLEMSRPEVRFTTKISIKKNSDYDNQKIKKYLTKLSKDFLTNQELKEFQELAFKVNYLPEDIETKITNIEPSYNKKNGEEKTNHFQRQMEYTRDYLMFLLRNKNVYAALQLVFLSKISTLRDIDTPSLFKKIKRLAETGDYQNASIKEKYVLKKAVELEYIYSVLADILSLGKIKKTISDLAIKYLKPIKYDFVLKHLNKMKIQLNSEFVVDGIKSRIEAAMQKAISEGSYNEKLNVSSRTKSIASLVGKIEKNKHLSMVYDYYAFRVISKNNKVLYHTLLELLPQKEKYSKIPKRLVYDILTYRMSKQTNDLTKDILTLGKNNKIFFNSDKIFNIKDYIKNPKDNGYQSLHTSIDLSSSSSKNIIPIEIQFRTAEMHDFAENGDADHNIYKEIAPVNGDKRSSKYHKKVYPNVKKALQKTGKIDENITEIVKVINKYMGFYFAKKNGIPVLRTRVFEED